MFRIIPRMCLIERQTKDLKRKWKQSSSKSIGMKYREEWSKIFQELVNEFADEFFKSEDSECSDCDSEKW